MAPVDSWIVQYTPFNGSPVNVTVPGPLRTFTLTGLSRGTSYSVRLAGVNAAGLGDFSTFSANDTAVDGMINCHAVVNLMVACASYHHH